MCYQCVNSIIYNLYNHDSIMNMGKHDKGGVVGDLQHLPSSYW